MKLLSLTLLLILSISIYLTYNKRYEPIDVDTRLKEVATKEYFETKIAELMEDKKSDELQDMVSLAKYLHIDVTTSHMEEKKSLFSVKKAKDIWSGFVYGKVDNETQFYSCIASDMTLVGDIRDFSIEGKKYLKDEDYDKFVLGLSSIGILLTATSYISFGTTSTMKVGTSTLKVAVKSEKLSKPFLKLISKKLSKTINYKEFKMIDFSSVSAIKHSFLKIKNSFNLSYLQKLTTNINHLKNNTSLYKTTKLLKYVESEKDLKKLMKLSDTYKNNTLTVMKILGKTALNGVKYSMIFLYQIGAFLLSFLFLLLLF